MTLSVVWAAAAVLPVLRGLAQAQAPKLVPIRARTRRTA